MDDQNIEEKKLKIDEERLTIEKEKNKREKRFINKHLGSVLTGAAIIVSITQVLIAINNYSFNKKSNLQSQISTQKNFQLEMRQELDKFEHQTNIDYITFIVDYLKRINGPANAPVKAENNLILEMANSTSFQSKKYLLSYLKKLEEQRELEVLSKGEAQEEEIADLEVDMSKVEGQGEEVAYPEVDIKMGFVEIPAGEFLMGAPKSDTMKLPIETPQHKVIIESAFYMQKTEVTQGQWKALMGSNPSNFKEGDSYPVESVSWNDVQEFITKLNKQSGKDYRLPTEAEWEYAAHAGTETKWYCGDDEGCLDSIAWYFANSENRTHPVGRKQANNWGLHDISGNVWEWCEDDWHGSYKDAPNDGGSWIDEPRGSGRVIRGGGWFSGARDCRSSGRGSYDPSNDGNLLGFRLVLPQVISENQLVAEPERSPEGTRDEELEEQGELANTENIDPSKPLFSLQQRFEYKTQLINDFLIPIANELKKSIKLHRNWRPKQQFSDAQEIYESNKRINLLLENQYAFIPSELRADRLKLLIHSENWNSEYNTLLEKYTNNQRDPRPEEKFKVATKGYPFPTEAAENFKRKLYELITIVYELIAIESFSLDQNKYQCLNDKCFNNEVYIYVEDIRKPVIRPFKVYIGILDINSLPTSQVENDTKLIDIIKNDAKKERTLTVWKKGDSLDFEYSKNKYKIIVTEIYDVPLFAPVDKINVIIGLSHGEKSLQSPIN